MKLFCLFGKYKETPFFLSFFLFSIFVCFFVSSSSSSWENFFSIRSSIGCQLSRFSLPAIRDGRQHLPSDKLSVTHTNHRRRRRPSFSSFSRPRDRPSQIIRVVDVRHRHHRFRVFYALSFFAFASFVRRLPREFRGRDMSYDNGRQSSDLLSSTELSTIQSVRIQWGPNA